MEGPVCGFRGGVFGDLEGVFCYRAVFGLGG